MSKDLQQHELRVLKEKEDLGEKINKLDEFLSSEKSDGIGANQHGLLLAQAFAMKAYFTVLELRIAAF